MNIGSEANKKDNTRVFQSRTILLQSGAARTVGLGTYPNIQPESDFIVSTNPDIGSNLGKSLEMVKVPGSSKVLGLYHLQNFGSKECNVTVSYRNIEDSHDESR